MANKVMYLINSDDLYKLAKSIISDEINMNQTQAFVHVISTVHDSDGKPL